MKHILVSISCNGILHWRLISAQLIGRRWVISTESYQKFLNDIGHQPGQRIMRG